MPRLVNTLLRFDRFVVAFVPWLWLGCGDGAVAEPKQASLVEAAAVAPDDLQALAMVNDPEFSRAQPYSLRHALMERLAVSMDAGRVDRRLNLAFDLLQADQAPRPCAVFREALDRIAASKDPYYADAVNRATVPTPGYASTHDEPCDGLEAARFALATSLVREPPDEPREVEAVPPLATPLAEAEATDLAHGSPLGGEGDTATPYTATATPSPEDGPSDTDPELAVATTEDGTRRPGPPRGDPKTARKQPSRPSPAERAERSQGFAKIEEASNAPTTVAAQPTPSPTEPKERPIADKLDDGLKPFED